MSVLLRRLSAPALMALAAIYLLVPLPAPGGGAKGRPASAAQVTGPDPLPLVPGRPAQLAATSPPEVLLTGSGWGHSVGLSQYGARAMALAGWTGHQILGHYYPGVKLGRLRNAAPLVRVNLFSERGINASQVGLSTSSRDGRPPSINAAVELGDGATHTLPFGQVWTLIPHGDGIGLRDHAGVLRGHGPGPARVRFAHTRNRPTLLALPQLGAGGRFQWGVLEVSRIGGTLQPVLVVPVEQYLRGIAEVPSDWPEQALRAQAITARTYALRQVQRGVQPGCQCHLGATQLHQVYGGWSKEAGAHGSRWTAAVEATAGEVVSYQGQLAWTYFSSSHGGRTEHSEQSWAYPNTIPYLRSVDDSWSLRPEAQNPYASWTRSLSNRAFAQVIGGGLAEVRGIRVLSRTAGGTPVELEVSGVDRAGAPKAVRWRGTRKGIAGADLKLAFRAELPSQQLSSLGLAPFTDDDGLPGEYDIARAAQSGLMGGCDGLAAKFCPHLPVTRGQAARWLGYASGMLLDVERPDAPADRHDLLRLLTTSLIADAARAQAIIGCAPDTCPAAPITRAEMAGFLVRTFL